jgi:hypothetical protein
VVDVLLGDAVPTSGAGTGQVPVAEMLELRAAVVVRLGTAALAMSSFRMVTAAYRSRPRADAVERAKITPLNSSQSWRLLAPGAARLSREPPEGFRQCATPAG